MKNRYTTLKSRARLLTESVKEIKGAELFGPAANHHTLEDLLDFLDDVVGEEATKATVAYGMLLAATISEGGGYREDALVVLDDLASTKVVLDASSCHHSTTVKVTANIVSQTQQFVEDCTIPCTEWPTSEEVVEKVLSIAKQYGKVEEWKRVVRNEGGAMIGVEKIE